MSNQSKVTLQVPDSLGDITLGQYQKYLKIIEANEGDDNAAEFINLKTIEIFCDIEFKDVLSIPLGEAEKVLSIISKAFGEKPELIRHFKLLDVDMGFIPSLETISLGEYIDVENNVSDWQTMHKAMAVLFRPVNFRSKERYTIAPYEPSDEVSELMKEMPLDVAMSSMVFFLRFRDGVTESYSDLYTEKSDGGTDLSAQANFGSKWGWYQSIYALAGGDVLKFDEVTQSPLFKCLTYLTFEKEKNELEAMMIKKAYKR